MEVKMKFSSRVVQCQNLVWDLGRKGLSLLGVEMSLAWKPKALE